MKIILSPAKSQDFESLTPTKKTTKPVFPKETQVLVSHLKKLSSADLMAMMSISKKLADLNRDRYKDWSKAPQKQAIFAFTGGVYRAFMNSTLSNKELKYLEKHLRIISGLYGVLTPLTTMKPYRLEMGRKVVVTSNKTNYTNLYNFWRDSITKYFAKEDVIINLASEEYSKVIDTSKLKGNIVNIVFKTKKDGVARIIAVLAKTERGNMSLWMARNNIQKVEDIKKYNQNGYRFSKSVSDENTFVFIQK